MPEAGVAGRAPPDTAGTAQQCRSLRVIEDFLDPVTAASLYLRLKTEQRWPDNHYEVFGRRFALPRLQTWHADKGIEYSYSNNLLKTQPWTPLLAWLKNRVEDFLGYSFNAVLVNFYRDGKDFVGWHSDDESELGDEPLIASLSLGTCREFSYRRKSDNGTTGCIALPGGSLLVMQPEFQRHWQHGVLQEGSGKQGRINLTFRQVNPPAGQSRDFPNQCDGAA